MAKNLPALGSARDVDPVVDFPAGAQVYAEHAQLLDDHHYALAYRRMAHGGQSFQVGDASVTGAAATVLYYLVAPMLHATTLHFCILLDAAGGGGNQTDVIVVPDAGGAPVGTWTQAAIGAGGAQVFSGTVGATPPGVLYRVEVKVTPGALATVDVRGFSIREEDLTAGEIAIL